MAQPTKADLLHIVEDAIHECGRHFLRLSGVGTHPADYQVIGGTANKLVRVYVWNLTHGGRGRPDDEWRIQATGIQQRFEQEPDGTTLILGWRGDLGVFAGFDCARHQGDLGTSPSIQLREAALIEADRYGLAVHNKGNGELAVAFRPHFLAAYIDNVKTLHATGNVPEEAELLNRVAQDPAAVAQDVIKRRVAEPRQFAVVSTQRALRESDFRRRVLTAYSHRCAMCGLALRLLDGAHILPAAHADSSDETQNGVALCALHHRAFDRAFVTFDRSYRVHVNHHKEQDLIAARQAQGLDEFKQALRPVLALPPDRRDHPGERFVEAANVLRGWEL